MHGSNKCRGCARRYFFELADVATTLKRRKKAIELSPLALEAVRRIDRVFDVERDQRYVDRPLSRGAPQTRSTAGRRTRGLDAR